MKELKESKLKFQTDLQEPPCLEFLEPLGIDFVAVGLQVSIGFRGLCT